MASRYRHDVAVVGAGRIGLPWAAVLARHGNDVVCIDVDDSVVDAVNDGVAPFDEPGLGECVERATADGLLRATTDPGAVTACRVVSLCLFCEADDVESYLDVVAEYAAHLDANQIVVNRTTLPLSAVERTRQVLADGIGVAEADVNYCVFPERLAEGQAIADIEELPKIVGSNGPSVADAMDRLLEPLSGDVFHTDPRTAMFVKLVDNSYRTARFALANRYAAIAERAGVDAHEAIELASHDFKHRIPSPGPVGGKCLEKDTGFLTEAFIGDDAAESDVFAAALRANDRFEDLILDKVSACNPASVAVLGTAFKPSATTERNSPGLRVARRLANRGVEVSCFDPETRDDQPMAAVLAGADAAVLVVPHDQFRRRGEQIVEQCTGPVVDAWGVLPKAGNVVRVGDGSDAGRVDRSVVTDSAKR